MIDSELSQNTNLETRAAQVQCLGSIWNSCLNTPCSMLPFFNKPFIHHVAERLVEHGFRSIDFVCHRNQADLEELLGTGVRWGATFRYLTSFEGREVDKRRDLSRNGGALKRISVASHTIPFSEDFDKSALTIRVDSPQHFLDSQMEIMRRGPEDFLTIEQEIGPSKWVGRNVKIHSSAKLEGPVVIGENTRVGPGVYLGPYTVVGSNCVLGRNSLIAQSAVMPGIYVGEGLRVSDSIVFADRVFNVRLGTSIEVSDSLHLSRIGGASL